MFSYPARDIKVYDPHLQWVANYMYNVIVGFIDYKHIQFDDTTL